MGNLGKKYKKIVDELIEKSFPKLKGKIIFVDFIFYKNFAAQVFSFGFFKIICLNYDKMKSFSKKELIALFCHELSHFEVFSRKTFFEKIIFILFVLFSRKMRFNNERETDMLAIKKGYGKELFLFASGRNKRYSKEKLTKIYNLGYLTPEEIKSYAKKIGKW